MKRDVSGNFKVGKQEFESIDSHWARSLILKTVFLLGLILALSVQSACSYSVLESDQSRRLTDEAQASDQVPDDSSNPTYNFDPPSPLVLDNSPNNDDDDADNEIARGIAESNAAVEDNSELALAHLLAAKHPSRPQISHGEVFLLEDKDYPKSVFEDYTQRIGQVSGITTLPNDEVVLFHRADRHWDSKTFNETTMEVAPENQDKLIKDNTIMILDRDGSALKSFGSDLFYMPHSVASDNVGNLWVSDVARHQVMRLPAMNILRMTNSTQVWPDIILGEAFVPGQDANHFCQPSEIAVSSNGLLVYVADGYCNQRVMVLSGLTGKFITSFGQQDQMRVVHSLTLIEERNLLCVADRENHRVLCYNAGLQNEMSQLGKLIHELNYPIGRVFAITSLSSDHLLVSSNQEGTSRYDLAVLNPFTHELKLVWISTDLLEPHSLSTTTDRQCVYAADLSKDAYKKVFKFHVIQRRN